MKLGSSTFYRASWRDGGDVERWLSRMAEGRTLNFPCGESPWGDVRADADPSLNPDVVADIRDPPFENRAFDTVYCDPPYSLCAYDTVYDWILKLWDVTNERLIVNMPTLKVSISEAEYSLYAEHRADAFAMSLYHVYDRPDTSLDDYSDR